MTVDQAGVAAAQPRPSRAIGSRTFVIAFAFFALLSTIWALATPVLSAPDENAHATKAIAQVRGQVIGDVVEGIRHLVVQLPDEYRYSANMQCYLTKEDVSAACAPELGVVDGQTWFNTWVGAYNPIYYYLVGWPTLLLDGNAGVYAMRIVSGLLSAIFLAWAVQAAFASIRSRWMPLGVAFLAGPMVLYLGATVNPQGVEIAAAAALWVGLLRLLQTFGGEPRPQLSRPYLWTIVAASAVMLANARATGPLWVVIVIAASLLLSRLSQVKQLFSTAKSYIPIGVIAAGGIFSLVWTLRGGSLSSQAGASDAPLVGGSFLQGARYQLTEMPEYLQQAMGYFGWFDTPLPWTYYWIAVAAFALLIGVLLLTGERRDLLKLSLVVVLALAIPVLIQAYSVRQTGIIWQGRYGLFLYIAIPLVAALLLSQQRRRVADFMSRRAVWVGATLLAVYSSLALFYVMYRYAVGIGGTFSQFVRAPEWQPPLGWIVLALLYVLVAAAGVFALGRAAQHLAARDDAAETSR